MPAAKRHVIVVGAGIIGAGIAWRLVDVGARVTIIDAGQPGGAASPCSFGWINATCGNPKPYFDLRRRSMAEWEVMAGEADGLPYRRSGTYYLDFTRVDFETFHAAHRALGYDIDWVGRDDIARGEPNVRDVPERALSAPREAVAEADETARLLVGLCKRAGAAVETGVTVLSLLASRDRVTGVTTDCGEITADDVVVAAGVGTQQLTASSGAEIALDSPPGLIIQTGPLPPLISRTILAGDLHLRQRADGVIIAGADFGGGEINDDPAAGAAELMRRLRRRIAGAENAELARYKLGLRPTPADGMPIVGRADGVPGLYVAVMHSGVTLMPAVSRFAADEIMTGERDALLEPFGIERVAAG